MLIMVPTIDVAARGPVSLEQRQKLFAVIMERRPPKSQVGYLAIRGLHAFGFASGNHDIDTVALYMRPTSPAWLVGFQFSKQKTYDPTITLDDGVVLDLLYKPVAEFTRLALGNKTESLNLLYTPEENVLGLRLAYKQYLLALRPLILLARLKRALVGYARNEGDVALGIGAKRDLGEKRKTAIETYGYSPKNAHHCIRLCKVGVLALDTGVWKVKWDPEVDEDYHLLEDIKFGRVPVNEVKELLVDSLEELETAKCNLPPEPQVEKVSALLLEFIWMVYNAGKDDL